MKVIVDNHPWTHYNIENVLDDKNFIKVKKFVDSQEPIPTGERRNFMLDKKIEVYSILKDALHNICNSINYTIKDDETELLEYSCCMPGYSYNKLHVDDKNKKFVFIYHVSDNGVGTKLYKFPLRSTYNKTTQWKQNGGTGFFRSFRSWHDWDTTVCQEPRVTFNLIVAKKHYASGYY